MNLLFIGDIIGEPGRKIAKSLLPELRKQHAVDFVIANGENSAGGFGITPAIADELFNMGIDVLTSGNHIWDKKNINAYLDRTPALLRPANYPQGNPGRGAGLFTLPGQNLKVGVLNLEGRVFMHHLLDPFTTAKTMVEELKKNTPIIFVDFHAEVTSEKRALGWYLDGQVSAVIGTHTHVQTADEQILPKGTAYLTDAGMTGGRDSIIGVNKEDVLHRFLYQTPASFTPAKGDPWLNGVVVAIHPQSGKAQAITRIQIQASNPLF
jgi:hypothetical protein